MLEEVVPAKFPWDKNDIMDCAQSKTLSDRLKKELKFLLLRPQNKEVGYD